MKWILPTLIVVMLLTTACGYYVDHPEPQPYIKEEPAPPDMPQDTPVEESAVDNVFADTDVAPPTLRN